MYRILIAEDDDNLRCALNNACQQLLKVLDDLTDEGYTNLNDTMEADFSCLTKLRAVLHRCGEAPFLIDHDRRVSAVTWQRC